MNTYEAHRELGNDGLHREVLYTEEEEWALDDAQERLRSQYGGRGSQQLHQLNGTSLMDSPRTSLPIAPVPLRYPVIIPQRRPGQRVRGFIRAYAPDLMGCGIDQVIFMDFLDELDKATATSPWIGAINIASNMAGLIPSAIAPPIGLAVQITAGVYQEMQSRKK
ncbi:hypothetical protein Daesc_002504 [Daldinia eschscholtzii]|uniref:Uncharacterized protein n=1 Tax=Daldinia eschscholtzii TaxID=292717 RepID=A0AAX6MX50_9PEZI